MNAMSTTFTTVSAKTPNLYRSTTDRKIKGVCGGIAERFGWDSSIVRIAFIVGSLYLGAQFSGVFFFSYVIAALVLNDKPAPVPFTPMTVTVTDADLLL
jgi:phage shock protein C